MGPRSRAKRFIAGLALVGGGAAAAIATLNYRVDPYAVHHHSSGDFYRIERTGRLTKAHWATDARPAALITGNSVAELSFDPRMLSRVAGVVSSFNVALPQIRQYELRRYAEHGIAVGDVEVLVIGLDFQMFSRDLKPQINFSESRLATTPQGRRTTLHRWRDLPLTTLSLDGVLASLNALRGPHATRCDYTKDGFRHKGECGGATRRIMARSLERNRKNVVGADYRRARLEDFARLLTSPAVIGLRVEVVIMPSHATHLAVLREGGMWDELEAWKRDLVTICDRARARGGARVELWDFSGFNHVTEEPLPRGREQMEGFLDARHVRPEIGSRMLREIFAPQASPPGGFGVRLTGANVDGHLKRIEAARERWLRAIPEDHHFAIKPHTS